MLTYKRKIVGVGADKSRRCESVYKGILIRPGGTSKKRDDVQREEESSLKRGARHLYILCMIRTKKGIR